MNKGRTQTTNKKTGRKTKLTKATTQKFVEAIKMGCTYSLACQYAGITPATFYTWMQQGKINQSKNKQEFFNAIKKAEADGAMTNLQLIHKAGFDDWRASAWIMERRHQYIKTNQVKIEEPEDTTQQSKTTKELLQQQQIDLLSASKQALTIGSFQAYASLQRQVMSVTLQLQALDLDSNELDTQSDEELIETITTIVKQLPPILQQKIKHDLSDSSKVLSIKLDD